MDAKRIRADDLMRSCDVNVSMEQMEEVEKKRSRCRLTALLESNNPAEVRHFVDELMDCLARENIFPPPPAMVNLNLYEQSDIDGVQEFVTAVTSAGNLIPMKALILFGLRVSVRFVQVFCPPPSPTMERRFLVDPEKLSEFLGTQVKGLPYHMSCFLMTRLSSPMVFVAACLTTWRQNAPWENFEVWGSVSTNAISAELGDVRKRQRLGNYADGEDYEHALLESAGEQALLE